MSTVKQVIILRKDLNMRKGKMGAQGAHASWKVFLDDVEHPWSGWVIKIPLWIAAKEWLTGTFTKVVCGCDSEAELLALHEAANAAGIQAGDVFTHLNGQPLVSIADVS